MKWTKPCVAILSMFVMWLYTLQTYGIDVNNADYTSHPFYNLVQYYCPAHHHEYGIGYCAADNIFYEDVSGTPYCTDGNHYTLSYNQAVCIRNYHNCFDDEFHFKTLSGEVHYPNLDCIQTCPRGYFYNYNNGLISCLRDLSTCLNDIPFNFNPSPVISGGGEAVNVYSTSCNTDSHCNPYYHCPFGFIDNDDDTCTRTYTVCCVNEISYFDTSLNRQNCMDLNAFNQLCRGFNKDLTRIPCNGHGTCMNGGTCRCDSGWIGDICAYETCTIKTFEGDSPVHLITSADVCMTDNECSIAYSNPLYYAYHAYYSNELIGFQHVYFPAYFDITTHYQNSKCSGYGHASPALRSVDGKKGDGTTSYLCDTTINPEGSCIACADGWGSVSGLPINFKGRSYLMNNGLCDAYTYHTQDGQICGGYSLSSTSESRNTISTFVYAYMRQGTLTMSGWNYFYEMTDYITSCTCLSPYSVQQYYIDASGTSQPGICLRSCAQGERSIVIFQTWIDGAYVAQEHNIYTSACSGYKQGLCRPILDSNLLDGYNSACMCEHGWNGYDCSIRDLHHYDNGGPFNNDGTIGYYNDTSNPNASLTSIQLDLSDATNLCGHNQYSISAIIGRTPIQIDACNQLPLSQQNSSLLCYDDAVYFTDHIVSMQGHDMESISLYSGYECRCNEAGIAAGYDTMNEKGTCSRGVNALELKGINERTGLLMTCSGLDQGIIVSDLFGNTVNLFCQCTPGWGSSNCEIPILRDGTNQLCGGTNRGYVVFGNTTFPYRQMCICNDPFVVAENNDANGHADSGLCRILYDGNVCPGTIQTSFGTTVCSGSGTCAVSSYTHNDKTCSCNFDSHGFDCSGSNAPAFKGDSGSNYACSNQGDADASGQCICRPGYVGPACQLDVSNRLCGFGQPYRDDYLVGIAIRGSTLATIDIWAHAPSQYITGVWSNTGYATLYPDVIAAGFDPWEHFYTIGYDEGRHATLVGGAHGIFTTSDIVSNQLLYDTSDVKKVWFQYWSEGHYERNSFTILTSPGGSEWGTTVGLFDPIGQAAVYAYAGVTPINAFDSFIKASPGGASITIVGGATGLFDAPTYGRLYADQLGDTYTETGQEWLSYTTYGFYHGIEVTLIPTTAYGVWNDAAYADLYSDETSLLLNPWKHYLYIGYEHGYRMTITHVDINDVVAILDGTFLPDRFVASNPWMNDIRIPASQGWDLYSKWAHGLQLNAAIHVNSVSVCDTLYRGTNCKRSGNGLLQQFQHFRDGFNANSDADEIVCMQNRDGDCSECSSTWWGDNCQNQCIISPYATQCSSGKIGTGNKCLYYRNGPTCDLCSFPYYGSDCSSICDLNLVSENIQCSYGFQGDGTLSCHSSHTHNDLAIGGNLCTTCDQGYTTITSQQHNMYVSILTCMDCDNLGINLYQATKNGTCLLCPVLNTNGICIINDDIIDYSCRDGFWGNLCNHTCSHYNSSNSFCNQTRYGDGHIQCIDSNAIGRITNETNEITIYQCDTCAINYINVNGKCKLCPFIPQPTTGTLTISSNQCIITCNIGYTSDDCSICDFSYYDSDPTNTTTNCVICPNQGTTCQGGITCDVGYVSDPIYGLPTSAAIPNQRFCSRCSFDYYATSIDLVPVNINTTRMCMPCHGNCTQSPCTLGFIRIMGESDCTLCAPDLFTGTCLSCPISKQVDHCIAQIDYDVCKANGGINCLIPGTIVCATSYTGINCLDCIQGFVFIPQTGECYKPITITLTSSTSTGLSQQLSGFQSTSIYFHNTTQYIVIVSEIDPCMETHLFTSLTLTGLYQAEFQSYPQHDFESLLPDIILYNNTQTTLRIISTQVGTPQYNFLISYTCTDKGCRGGMYATNNPCGQQNICSCKSCPLPSTRYSYCGTNGLICAIGYQGFECSTCNSNAFYYRLGDTCKRSNGIILRDTIGPLIQFDFNITSYTASTLASLYDISTTYDGLFSMQRFITSTSYDISGSYSSIITFRYQTATTLYVVIITSCRYNIDNNGICLLK